MNLRPTVAADAAGIARIYNHYVRETWITFETDEVDSAAIASRMEVVRAAGLPWLAAFEADDLLGYAYASKWHGRCAYRYTAESTIYLAPNAVGRGVGRALYGAVLASLRDRGLHAVIGAISLPNAASVGLHEALGFAKSGHFREVGHKFGHWVDVGYWQLLLVPQAAGPEPAG
jgi:L-amino acid N-acyltransferase YncA